MTLAEAKENAETQNPLPQGWRWVRLGEVCKQDRQVIDSGSANNLPYIGLENVESNTGRISFTSAVTRNAVRSTTFVFDERHVLYGKLRPYLNKVALPNFKGRCTTELIPLLVENGISREFIAWVLRSGDTVGAAMREKTGSRMPRADMEALLAISIPLPPTLTEQKSIASILNEQMAAVEKARAAAEARLEAAKALPAAYLLKALDNPEEKGWRWVRLGDLFDVKQGVAMSPLRRQGIAPHPFLRTLNVLWGSVDLSSLDKMDFTDDEVASLNLRNGDLLVCEGGDVGRTAIWRGELDSCLYQNHIHRLRRRDNNVAPDFYAYWMQAAFKVFQSYKGKALTTTIPNLSGGILKSFMVPLPLTLEEQERIACILSEQMAAVEKIVQTVQQELEAINVLPATLLRRGFTGGL